MTKRDVVTAVLEGSRPPYVPWSYSFTVEAKEKLVGHYGHDNIIETVDNHILGLGSDIGFFDDCGKNRVRDVFGVVWDRTIDKDIGNVEGSVLCRPSLDGYEFPDPLDRRFSTTSLPSSTVTWTASGSTSSVFPSSSAPGRSGDSKTSTSTSSIIRRSSTSS